MAWWRSWLAVSVLVGLSAGPASAASAARLEYSSGDGYVFVRSFQPDGTPLGFAIDDADGVGLWASYQRLGGLRRLGPPLGARYACGTSTCQAFVRAVLRWNPLRSAAEPVDVLVELGQRASQTLLERVLNLHLSLSDGSARGEELFGITPGFAGVRDVLGSDRELVMGPVAAAARDGPTTVLMGTRAALIDPGTGGPVTIIGSGELAFAAGWITAAALVPRPVPLSAARAPVTLSVPRLALETGVLRFDPASDGSLPAPEQPEDVAWYTDSARLGEGGTMLMAGHVDWAGRAAAFRDLGQLEPADRIAVRDSAGVAAVYRVVAIDRFAEGSPALHRLMVNSGFGPATLTLVTCGGPFDLASRSYLERLVVRAELISGPDEPVEPSAPRSDVSQ